MMPYDICPFCGEHFVAEEFAGQTYCKMCGHVIEPIRSV